MERGLKKQQEKLFNCLKRNRWWFFWHSKLCLNKTRGWKIISLLKSVQKVEFEFVSLSFNLIRVEISAWPRVNVLAVKYQNKVQNYQFCFIKKAEIFQWWTARQKEAIWTHFEHILNAIWTQSEHILITFWTQSEPNLNTLWTRSEHILNTIWTIQSNLNVSKLYS